MKKYLLAGLMLVACLLVVSLIGCGTSGSEVTTTTVSTTSTTTTTTGGGSTYFPHTDGYIWTYDYIMGGETGSMVMSFEGTHTIGTLETQIMKQCSMHPLSPYTAEAYIIVTDAGVRLYGSASSPTTEGYISLPFPLSLGGSWSFQSLGSLSYCSITSYESVTVPAGTFDNCYKIYTTRESGSSINVNTNEWYAPDVGVVKNNNISINTGLITATFELTSKNFPE